MSPRAMVALALSVLHLTVAAGALVVVFAKVPFLTTFLMGFFCYLNCRWASLAWGIYRRATR